MAHCGGFIMGVKSLIPNMPRFVIVKVPPVTSSTESSPFLAFSTKASPSEQSDISLSNIFYDGDY